MQSISSTHPSASVKNARFAPAGNNFARTVNSSKQQLDGTTIRARNKELAKQYASEAMVMVAAKMDLDALYAKGDGAPGDFWKALECYLKAVHQSHAHAQASVGDLFSEGQGMSKDKEVAMGWYIKATSQDDTNSSREVETLTLSQLRQTAAPNAPIDNTSDDQQHRSNPTDVQPPDRNSELQIAASTFEGVDQILLNANLGDKDAQIARGDMYEGGKGVSQDYQPAMEWYLKAADQGDARAQHNIGAFYCRGRGGSPDYARAMDWFLKSANQGHAESQYNIGILYSLGQGVPQDYEQAMDWYLKAASQGNARAQFNVGYYYEYGQGVSQDDAQATEWYQRAADQGHAKAKAALENMRKNGRIVG